MAGESGQSQNSSGNEGGGAGGDDGGVDISSLMAEMQERFGDSQSELQNLRGEQRQTAATIDRIKKALGGDEGDGKTAAPEDAQIAHYEGQIDRYVSAAIEAERQGKAIPLTVNAAIESFKGHIAALQEKKAMRAELAELKAKVAQVSDPSRSVDNTAYSNIDSGIQNALTMVYGDTAEVQDVKAAQFKSISSLIIEEIKDLQQNDPKMWDRIRRNPTDQKKLVQYFAEKTIPPRARELMDTERMKNTPLTMRDLKDAWEEAKGITDVAARTETMSKIRQRILSEVYSGGKGKRADRVGANDLFG